MLLEKHTFIYDIEAGKYVVGTTKESRFHRNNRTFFEFINLQNYIRLYNYKDIFPISLIYYKFDKQKITYSAYVSSLSKIIIQTSEPIVLIVKLLHIEHSYK